MFVDFIKIVFVPVIAVASILLTSIPNICITEAEGGGSEESPG